MTAKTEYQLMALIDLLIKKGVITDKELEETDKIIESLLSKERS
ncbi:hypothetical protein [Oceanobacillus sp. FSL H7-0719]